MYFQLKFFKSTFSNVRIYPKSRQVLQLIIFLFIDTGPTVSSSPIQPKPIATSSKIFQIASQFLISYLSFIPTKNHYKIGNIRTKQNFCSTPISIPFSPCDYPIPPTRSTSESLIVSFQDSIFITFQGYVFARFHFFSYFVTIPPAQ